MLCLSGCQPGELSGPADPNLTDGPRAAADAAGATTDAAGSADTDSRGAADLTTVDAAPADTDALAQDAASAVDSGADLTPVDSAVDAPPPQCTTHCDCQQGAFCYQGKCLTDPRHPVYCCTKAGCPPGSWCIDGSGQRSTCAESAAHPCQTACDCGPAHCCIVTPGQTTGVCVKDVDDPRFPGGTAINGLSCQPGVDPTYCCSTPECQLGKLAYAKTSSSFRCVRAKTGDVDTACGGAFCYGSSCNCAAGESCVDTLPLGQKNALAPPGKSCGALAGGTCVSNSLAEAVFGFAAADLLPCCATGCSTPGAPCIAGAHRSGGRWAYQRLVARCEPTPANGCACGDAVCCVSEVKTCPQDCSCGDGICQVYETLASCAADCTPASCGDGSCSGSETQVTCPADCPGRCEDASVYPGLASRVCGNGVCGDPASPGVKSTCDWSEPESCRTCPQDCGACQWKIIRGTSATVAKAEYFWSVWGASTSDVFAVGRNGTIIHYDGARWNAMTSGVTGHLRSVWGSSSSNVFAVGIKGTILHFDGASWTKMSSPSTDWLYGVWGTAASDVWAVGDQRILRYDGSGWTSSYSGPEALRAVWGSASSDIWAVGDKGNDQGGAVHFDGTSWTQVTVPPSETLSAVIGTAANNVYALSTDGTVVRYAGSGWKTFDPLNVLVQMNGLWAAPNGNLLAVGDDNEVHLHDGSGWKQIAGGKPPVDLQSIWGVNATDAFIVGHRGSLLRFDGASLLSARPPVIDYQHAWGTSGGPLFVTGRDGSDDPVSLRYDGTAWTALPLPVGTRPIVSIDGLSPTAVHAATLGTNWLAFDGTKWSAQPTGWSVPFNAIWAVSSSDVWAVGNTHTYRYDGSVWKSVTSLGGLALWGAPGGDVFVGTFDALWRYDQSNWSKVATIAAASQISEVWGTSASDLFFATLGPLYHYDGTSVTTALPNSNVYGIWGASSSDVVAVSSHRLFQFDGTGWSAARVDLREHGTSSCRTLLDVAPGPAGKLYVVGYGELVLERQ